LPIRHPSPTHPPHPGPEAEASTPGLARTIQERERLLETHSARNRLSEADSAPPPPRRTLSSPPRKAGNNSVGKVRFAEKVLARRRRPTEKRLWALPRSGYSRTPAGADIGSKTQARRHRINKLRLQLTRALQTLLTKTFFFTLNR